MKNIFTVTIILLSFQTYSQTKKNNIEAGVLGNIGFFHLGYGREILSIKKIHLDVSSKIGYVPGAKGSEIEESNPNFTHLNIGSNISLLTLSSRFGIGISYSKIFVGNDVNNVRNKNDYNRILGDINYTLYLSDKEEKNKNGIKVSFMPILYDDGVNDMDNIPARIAFTFEF